LQLKRSLLQGSADTAYELLGVKKDATDAEINKAYRNLCLRYHPDKKGDPVKFLAVQRAYHAIKEMRKEERGEGDVVPEEQDEEQDRQTEANVEEKEEIREDAIGESNTLPTETKTTPHWLYPKLQNCLEEVKQVRTDARMWIARQVGPNSKTYTMTYTIEGVKSSD